MADPVLFPLPPDDSSPLTVTYEWRTDVLTSEGGAEQRVSLRAAPLRTLSFGVHAMGRGDTATLASLIERAPDHRYYVPFWPDAVETLADVAAGGVEVLVPWDGGAFRTATHALFFAPDGSYELVEVNQAAAVDGVEPPVDLVTLSHPTIDAWPLDSIIVPVFIGILRMPLPMDHATTEDSRVELAFTSETPVVGVQRSETGEEQVAPITKIELINMRGVSASNVISSRLSYFRAVCYDATGAIIARPSDFEQITWSISGTNTRVVPALDPTLARVYIPPINQSVTLMVSAGVAFDTVDILTNNFDPSTLWL